ncbi:MAG TPA: TIGR04211 family SH3 domain-containing protein [Cellvibrionaceae bacterium]
MTSLKSIAAPWVGVFGVIWLSLGTAQAETLFISDVCYASLRAGQTNDSKVVHSGLKTGTVVTLVEAPAESDWSRVKTESGQEGWVRRQFLTAGPTAQMQLDKFKNETANRPAPVDPAAEVPAACQGYAAELASLKALSTDAVNLNKRYQDLLAEHEMAKTSLDSLRAENERLKGSTQHTQWIYGGILVAAGILLTLLIQAFKPSRRSEWV